MINVLTRERAKRYAYTNPSIPKLKEWAAALRSGKYEQGQRRLKSVNPHNPHNGPIKYCCLGVYGEINGNYVDKYSIDSIKDGYDFIRNQFDWRLGDGLSTFMIANDGNEGSPVRSFFEIADFIDMIVEETEKLNGATFV